MIAARIIVIAAGLLAGAVLSAEPALADPPCGRGWRKGEWCGPRVRHHRHRPPRPVVVAPPPPVYYAPPPVVVAPPPPVYYAPPPVVVAPARPSVGLHVDIPLR